MKEIKYRVYQPIAKKFYYWGFVEKGTFIGVPVGAGLTLDDCLEKSQQYTGLKDRNGKEIYVGDVIKAIGWKGSAYSGDVVEFRDGAFECSYGCRVSSYSNLPIEVIGNIHENPELVGGD